MIPRPQERPILLEHQACSGVEWAKEHDLGGESVSLTVTPDRLLANVAALHLSCDSLCLSGITVGCSWPLAQSQPSRSLWHLYDSDGNMKPIVCNFSGQGSSENDLTAFLTVYSHGDLYCLILKEMGMI